MDLQKKQMGDKNRVAHFGTVTISAFVGIMTVIGFVNGVRTDHMIRFVTALMVGLINTFTYFKLFRYDEKYERCVCLSLIVLYVVVLLTSDEPAMYAIVYPIAIMIMTFAKKRLIQIGSWSAVIFLLIGHIILAKRGGVGVSTLIIEAIFTIVACVLASRITGMLVIHGKENIDAVKDLADEQLETSNIIVGSAKELNLTFESAQDISNVLNDRMEVSHTSVAEIAKATKHTAEAIEEQTKQTAEIQNSIQNVGEESKAMGEISERTSASVFAGVELIEQLENHAKEVAEINLETKEITEMLNISIKDVQEITNTILGISAQTNLLALNASIEAARAGEAGKGFAVVADEIRALSEGTRAATSQITEIIGRLTQDANSASESMMKSAEYARKQQELITETGQKLADIKNDTDDLRSGLQNVQNSVDTIIDSNTQIMDGIANLSSMSEEVAASTETVLAESDSALDALKDMNGLLETVAKISKNMEETCSQ